MRRPPGPRCPLDLAGKTGGGDQLHQYRQGKCPGSSMGRCGVPGSPSCTLAAPRPRSHLNFKPEGPHLARSQSPATEPPPEVLSRELGRVFRTPEEPGDRALSCLRPSAPLRPCDFSVRGLALPWSGASQGHDSPREDQAQQGAEQDQDLVEHGRLRPQDGPVEVVLRDRASVAEAGNPVEPRALPRLGVGSRGRGHRIGGPGTVSMGVSPGP